MAQTKLDLLKEIYETLPHPVVIGDAERKIIGVNRAMHSIFEYAWEELEGRTTEMLYADPSFFRQTGKAVFARKDPTPATYEGVIPFKSKSGRVFRSILLANQVQSEDGTFYGVGIIRELTDILALEEDRAKVDRILRTAFDTLPDAFVIYDPEDRLVISNEAYKRLYSISAPAIKEGERFENILRYGLKHGQYPEAGKSQEEHEAWLSARLKAHFEPSGAIQQSVGPEHWLRIEEKRTHDGYTIGIRSDVSSIVLAKSEAEFMGNLVDRVRHEVYVFQQDTLNFLSVNKGALENLGYELSEMRARTLADILADLSKSDFLDLLEPVISGATQGVSFDATFQRKDETSYPVSVRLERNDTAHPPVFVAFVEDRTETLAKERAIEEERKRFERLILNLPDVVTLATPDMVLTYSNSVYASFLNTSVDFLVGRCFLDFVPEPHRQEVLDQIDSLTPEMPLRTFEQPMVDAYGRHHTFLWSNLMVYEDGRKKEIVSVGRDITELANALAHIESQRVELDVRNTALEQFASVVSHDLKAPMRHLSMYSEMMTEDIEAGEFGDLPRYAGRIQNSTAKLQRMISSLLAFSQVAYRSIEVSTFELLAVVEEAIETVQRRIDETGGAIHVDTLPAISADRDLMVRLMQNLIENAVKYSSADQVPQVTIRGGSSRGEIWVAVSDNGIGIPAEHAKRVFGVFHRLHKDDTTYSGAGVGLALCQKIVEAHQGAIEVDTSYRDGARIVVRIPRQPR